MALRGILSSLLLATLLLGVTGREFWHDGIHDTEVQAAPGSDLLHASCTFCHDGVPVAERAASTDLPALLHIQDPVRACQPRAAEVRDRPRAVDRGPPSTC